MHVKYTVWEASPRYNTTLYGGNKNLVVNNECNAALEILINVANYVEQTDLILLGEWS